MTRPSGIDDVRIGNATVSKWQIKVVLTVLGLGIMGAVLFYTKTIVDDLVLSEVRTVELYANLLARFQHDASDDDLLFYIDNTYASIHFPVIITNSVGEPTYPFEQFMLNVDLDSTLDIKEQGAALRDLIAEMEQEYPPYEIKAPDGTVLQKMYFTNSAIVRRLRYMPYVEILIVSAFILVGYIAFSTIRRDEESNIWVECRKRQLTNSVRHYRAYWLGSKS